MIGLITSRPFEFIRDQIIQILNLELPNQNTLQPNTGLNASIFKERFVNIQSSELPAVNVGLANGDYGLITSISQDGTFTYFIDCYQKAPYSDGNRGDTEASVKLQKLVGVVQAILMDSRYITLGFERPYIMNRTVTDIKFAEPKDTKDSDSVVMARITLTVRADSKAESITPVLIDGFDTVALINGTIYGHVFSGESFIPDPIPDFVLITNSDGSFSVQAPNSAPYELPDIDVNVKNTDGIIVKTETFPSVIDVEIEAPNGTAKALNSNGDIIKEWTVPSGATVSTQINDTEIKVRNTDGEIVATGISLGGAVSADVELPDETFNIYLDGILSGSVTLSPLNPLNQINITLV